MKNDVLTVAAVYDPICPKLKMKNTEKRTRSKETGPRTTCGAVLALNVFPEYAKDAYPGLISRHASGMASPEGCRELSLGWSVLCDTRG